MAKIQRVRRVKNKNFTSVSNLPARDTELSDKALGFWFRIMSLPDDWDFSISGMVSITPSGRDCVYSTISELVAKGYCVRTEIRDKGRFKGWDYVFYEEPVTPHTGFPDTDKPDTDKPDTENPTQLNTYLIKDVTDKSLKKKSANADVKAVFEFWQDRLNHPRAKLDSSRKRVINARLKDFSVDQLLTAIVGVSQSPFHLGDNPQNTKYDDFKTIFRDAAQVEKFIGFASDPPQPQNNGKSKRPTYQEIYEDAAEWYREHYPTG